jgi:hypothetical protein
MSKIICNFSHLNLNPELDVYFAHERIQYYMKIYYTLLFYFPYLSLLAHPVTIFVYRPAIILDKKYNIANSSCHFGSYGPVHHQKNIIWTSEASVHIIYFGDGPVHILPYDPQCHELFAIYCSWN